MACHPLQAIRTRETNQKVFDRFKFLRFISDMLSVVTLGARLITEGLGRTNHDSSRWFYEGAPPALDPRTPPGDIFTPPRHEHAPPTTERAALRACPRADASQRSRSSTRSR